MFKQIPRGVNAGFLCDTLCSSVPLSTQKYHTEWASYSQTNANLLNKKVAINQLYLLDNSIDQSGGTIKFENKMENGNGGCLSVCFRNSGNTTSLTFYLSRP